MVTCAEKGWAERGGLLQLDLAMGSFALLLIRWSRALLQLPACGWAIYGGLCAPGALAALLLKASARTPLLRFKESYSEVGSEWSHWKFSEGGAVRPQPLARRQAIAMTSAVTRPVRSTLPGGLKGLLRVLSSWRAAGLSS